MKKDIKIKICIGDKLLKQYFWLNSIGCAKKTKKVIKASKLQLLHCKNWWILYLSFGWFPRQNRYSINTLLSSEYGNFFPAFRGFGGSLAIQKLKNLEKSNI